MRLWPLAKDAIATARMVCDLEPGIATIPFNRDFFTINFIATIVLRISYCVLRVSLLPEMVRN